MAEAKRGKREWLPAGPFIEAVERRVDVALWSQPGHEAKNAAHGGMTVETVVEGYGINARRFNEYRRGTNRSVDSRVVDRFLIASGLNWWDIWDPVEYPEVEEILGATG